MLPPNGPPGHGRRDYRRYSGRCCCWRYCRRGRRGLLLRLLLRLLLQLLRRRRDVHADNAAADLHGRRRTQHKIDSANFRRSSDSNRSRCFRIDTARDRTSPRRFLQAAFCRARHRRNIVRPPASAASPTALEFLLSSLARVRRDANSGNRADIVIARSEPVEPVFAKIIGLNLPLETRVRGSVLIGVGQRLHLNSRDGFEDFHREFCRRSFRPGPVGNVTPESVWPACKRYRHACACPAALPIFLRKISVAIDANSVGSGGDVGKVNDPSSPVVTLRAPRRHLRRCAFWLVLACCPRWA